ncbi:condensation domain-containing protein [Streptomyces sp. NBC_01298]|uniref:condensation domain-containing protein n=1 Tax=Streptomyces sp. NBC_01298 TaxID=2903817 RepID=UPI002E1136BC|nr:condensation domain-containing protein [Streptomyces sp. NBC_01298]
MQIPAEAAEIEPGHAYTWRISFPDLPADPGSRRPASYNQAAHLAAACSAQLADQPPPFGLAIACTFELTGPVDLPALEAALMHLVHRHEVLRTCCRRTARSVSIHVRTPEEAHLERVDAGPRLSRVATRAHLHELLQLVDPATGPLMVAGAIVREGSTTVHVVYDHLVADVISAPITVADLARTYEDLTHGRRPDPTPAGSYIDFAREERTHNLALRAQDEQLQHWREFLTHGGDHLPAFPLDLGVPPDHVYPPVNRTRTLLPGPLTDQLETACRTSGGSLLTGLLAATAASVREEGGPDIYRALMPINRRGRNRYSRSIGWFINALPLAIPAPRRASLATRLALARAGYEPARQQADVHSVRAQQLLRRADATSDAHRPASFFSYLDFRTTPGAEHPSTRTATVHVWSPACNGSFLWFHRNHSGLHLNSLHADTPLARQTTDSLAHRLVRNLLSFSE